MRFRPRTGGRRELEKRALAAEADAQGLRAALQELAPGEGGEIPPQLLAAASMAGPDGQAVKFATGGLEVIAVIGDEGGSSREWLRAIREGLHQSGIAS